MNEADVFFMQECARHALSMPSCEGAQFLEGWMRALRDDDPKRAAIHSAYVQLAAGADQLERIADGHLNSGS